MPMKSKAQRAYLHIHHPKIAERFERETPKDAKLPEKAKSSRYSGASKGSRKAS